MDDEELGLLRHVQQDVHLPGKRAALEVEVREEAQVVVDGDQVGREERVLPRPRLLRGPRGGGARPAAAGPRLPGPPVRPLGALVIGAASAEEPGEQTDDDDDDDDDDDQEDGARLGDEVSALHLPGLRLHQQTVSKQTISTMLQNYSLFCGQIVQMEVSLEASVTPGDLLALSVLFSPCRGHKKKFGASSKTSFHFKNHNTGRHNEGALFAEERLL